ncbi:MAG: class I SAM-dependent methyltransferase [Acidimicrobiales bacterium]
MDRARGPALTLGAAPDGTAERVALWRALHTMVDAAPHVLEDVVGLELVAPGEGWRARPDMDPEFTRGFRASVVARARTIDDLVVDESRKGVSQYVLLGAGLDTFSQRRPDVGARMFVFEVDRPGQQAWKRQRLVDLGYGVPAWLRLVPTDFETPDDWYEKLSRAGFDPSERTVVASTGVSMYLTKESNRLVLEQAARFASGSTLAMSFLVPPELLDGADRAGLEVAASGAQSTGAPFLSFYDPEEMLAAARDAGFRVVRHVPGASLAERYFVGRADGLRPSSGEDFLVAAT